MSALEEILKQAAREYLAAVEGDGPLEDVANAKDYLAEIAMLWAQSEAIEKVENKKNPP